MHTKIYVMTHKAFEEPTDSMYIPLHVGRKGCKRDDSRLFCINTKDTDRLFGYLGDDTGNSISEQNCYYSELTGLYWVWKNAPRTKYVGTSHYRRYLVNDKNLVLTESEIDQILQTYDFITTKELQLNFSYYDGFAENHKKYYLDETQKVIHDLYPDYEKLFVELVHGKQTYFGNLLITDWNTFDAYMTWLFSILFTLQQRIVIEEEDSYHRRIFGFISEFLQFVWVKKNNLKVYECKVGMIGEKTEVTAVKNQLARFLEAGELDNAKAFFLDSHKKRPDILMEASDITGELHLCMQVIATAGLERQKYQTTILERKLCFADLMEWCNTLNHYTIEAAHNGVMSKEGLDWMEKNEVSPVARAVSAQMFEGANFNKFGGCHE